MTRLISISLFFIAFYIFIFSSCSPSQSAENAEAAGEVQVGDRPGQTKDKKPIWFRDQAIAAELELTEQQIEALAEITRSANEKAKQIRVAERKIYTMFLRTLNQEEVDEVALQAAVKRYEDTILVRLRRQTTRLTEIRRILTREQWFTLMDRRPQVFLINKFTPVGEPKPLNPGGVLITE